MAGRPTDQPTDKPKDGHEGSVGIYTSNLLALALCFLIHNCSHISIIINISEKLSINKSRKDGAMRYHAEDVAGTQWGKEEVRRFGERAREELLHHAHFSSLSRLPSLTQMTWKLRPSSWRPSRPTRRRLSTFSARTPWLISSMQLRY